MIVLLAVVIAALGIVYAAYGFVKVKTLPEGTKEMSEIAKAIRIGANTFLFNEYKVLIPIVLLLAILFAIFLSTSSAVAFLIGVIMSAVAGFVGMQMATYANVRVTNEARTTKNIGKTLKVALRGGSVMGLCVSSFALIGLAIVFFTYREQIGLLESVTNRFGISFVPFSMTLTSYSLGCSIVAMFNRVGGGIYTKAADMGADLVGKTEENIPEDDPRNPAVIADCVGDNVGDTAGLGSDLLESYMGAIVSGIVLVFHLFISYKAKDLVFTQELFESLYMFPIAVGALGLLSCIIGLAYVFTRPNIEDPHKEMNKGTWIAAGLTAVTSAVAALLMFLGKPVGDLPFKLGIMSPWLSAVMGIICGIVVGQISEYYTSYDYKPTQKLAKACENSAAITITEGLSVGMKSTMLTVAALGLALLIANWVSGMFGIAMAAVGMLSFVSITVSVDTYGPISDNAGGIAEMTHLGEDVRNITDKLDAVGNTTAAIGKGFAIGSAAFATVSLMISYLYTFTPIHEEVVLDMMNPMVLVGVFCGAALTFFFSGQLIESVSNSAQKMVREVRRQFKKIPGLKEGTAQPDYKRCVEIATRGALAEMKTPAVISVFVPVVSGFIFGPVFVAGILVGATVAAIMLAVFCGNSGGAWDNAKKYIESLGRKGSEEHHAAVVGDTVGDPLKDTVGPSLDILIKIMSTVSIIFVCIYSKYNLIELISMLFK